MKGLSYHASVLLAIAMLLASGCTDTLEDVSDDAASIVPQAVQLVESIAECSEQALLERTAEANMPETHVAHDERCVVGIYRNEGDGFACTPRYHRDYIGIYYYQSGTLVATVTGNWYVDVFDSAGNRLIDGSYGLDSDGNYVPDDMWYRSFDQSGRMLDLRVDEAYDSWFDDELGQEAVVQDHTFATYLDHSDLDVVAGNIFDSCQRTIYRSSDTAEELPTQDELEGIVSDQNCRIEVVHADEAGNITFFGVTHLGPSHDGTWLSRDRFVLTYENGVLVMSEDYRSDWSTPDGLDYELTGYTNYTYDDEGRVELIEYWVTEVGEEDRITYIEEYDYGIIPDAGYTMVTRTDWGFIFDRFEYNSDGREVEHWEYYRWDSWPANQVESLTKTQYDTVGRVVAREHYENERYELLDDPHSVPEFPEWANTLVYDERGRIAKETFETRTWWGATRTTVSERRYICNAAP